MNSKSIIEKIGMLKWLWITVVLFILDQITKQWAEHVLIKFNPVEIIPNLNLYLAYNKGAAFSLLNDAGGWQRWFFTTIAIIISVALIYWVKTLKPNERVSAVGLAFILSGALGNVTDRILFGYVIDFIQFYYQADSCLPGFSHYSLLQTSQCIWPAFNIADSAIAVGATILIFLALKEAYQDWQSRRQSN